MLHNLFQISKKNKDSFSVKLASKKHAIFQAHFPSNPLLPGFLLIEICSEVLGHEVVGIKKAKFIKPILPKDEIDFLFKEKETTMSIKVFKEAQKVAEILYEKI